MTTDNELRERAVSCAREVALEYDLWCEQIDDNDIEKLTELICAALERERDATVAGAFEAAAQHVPVIYDVEDEEQAIFCCTECNWKGPGNEWAQHIRSLIPADAQAVVARKVTEARLEEARKYMLHDESYEHEANRDIVIPPRCYACQYIAALEAAAQKGRQG